MSLPSCLRRIGFAAAAIAALALGAAGFVAPRAAAAAPAPMVHATSAHHDHVRADAGHMEPAAADHDGHAAGGTCGDACCGPVGCALPVPPIAARLIAVSVVNANWLPAGPLMDLGLAYAIERPPRG